jgi:hypothetical protein
MAHSRGKSEADPRRLRRFPHVPMRRRLLQTKGPLAPVGGEPVRPGTLSPGADTGTGP